VPQFRFERDGVVVQDWSTSSTFVDAPVKDASYKAKVRCSSNTACASVVGAVSQALVYTGDGNDIVLSGAHDVSVRSTVVLSWPARPQLSSVDGYDVFRGFFNVFNGDPNLTTLTCLSPNVPQQAVGNTVSVSDPAIPSLGGCYYYLVGHNAKAPGALDPLGKRSNGTILIAPITCP
jgi:hypothetical protein